MKRKSTTQASKRDMLHLLHLKRRRSGGKDSVKTKKQRSSPLRTMKAWVETSVKCRMQGMTIVPEVGAWVAGVLGVLAVSETAALRSPTPYRVLMGRSRIHAIRLKCLHHFVCRSCL